MTLTVTMTTDQSDAGKALLCDVCISLILYVHMQQKMMYVYVLMYVCKYICTYMMPIYIRTYMHIILVRLLDTW